MLDSKQDMESDFTALIDPLVRDAYALGYHDGGL